MFRLQLGFEGQGNKGRLCYRLGMFRLQRYSKSQVVPSVRLRSLQSTANYAKLLGGRQQKLQPHAQVVSSLSFH